MKTQSNVTLDFKITTMGIRILVAVITLQVWLLNTSKISAWHFIGSPPQLFTNTSNNTSYSDAAVAAVANAALRDEREYSVNNRIVGVQNHKQVGSSDEWDFLTLTIQWPQAFCKNYNDSHSGSDKCVVPPFIKYWTIHGLWPSNSKGDDPLFCNNSWKFNLQNITDIETELNVSWTDFLVEDEYDALWDHEWSKHGTCAATLPALYGEHKFFQTTLSLYKKFDVLSMLAVGGISPSATQTYSYESIFAAVRNGLGTDPSIECIYDKEKSTVYLSEVEICLGKDLALMDCVAQKRRRSRRNLREENCLHDKGIFYLPLS